MSGGSLEYFFLRMQDVAGEIRSRSSGRTDGVLLRAFASHLDDLSTLIRAVEWDFSNDSDLSPEDHSKLLAITTPKKVTKFAKNELLQELTNHRTLMDTIEAEISK